MSRILLKYQFAVFVFTASLVHAQYGPFGIGNSTGADGQPKLLVWFDGTSTNVVPGSDVLIWNDLSGNGNDFIAPSASESPILSISNLNGRPYFEFNKANNRMIFDNLNLSSGDLSIFYVIRGNDAKYGVFSFSDGVEPRKILIHEESNQHRFTVNGNEISTGQGDIGASTTVWRYAGVAWSPTSSQDYFHRSSGTGAPELGATNVHSSQDITSTGNAAIGHIKTELADINYIAGDAFVGDIAEIFIFDGQVNKAMLRMINTYFRNKYGVGGTSSWDKLQAPATHRSGLIGIGRDDGSSSEHRYSRSEGLVFRANPGGINGAYAYLSAGNEGTTNTVVTTDITGAVQERWSRDYYIKKDGLGNPSDIQIAFDLAEGIGGDFPFAASNYELLYRSGTSGDYLPRAVTEKSINGHEVVFRLSGTQIPASGYITLGTTNAALSPVDGQLVRTWYAYQTGTWTDPATWTLDGSSAPNFINPGNDLPGNADAVVISSGRTITLNTNDVLLSSLNLVGILDVGATSGHNFNAISGNGLLRCAGSAGISNFPLGNTANFADALTGGNVEFYGAGFTQVEELLVRNLEINLSSASNRIVMAHKLTHTGSFEITRGTLEVDIPVVANRTIESKGNVVVESNGRIEPKSSGLLANYNYNWNFSSDLINNGGIVRFTNRIEPAIATYYVTADTFPRITARFINPTTNQQLVANGTTVLTRLVVNKGTESTYILTLSANAANRFYLLGRCNGNAGESAYIVENSNPNSCALINGTLEVQENVFVPLSTGGNYNINNSATLWVNGGIVAKGAPHVLGATNSIAIVAYGGIKVSAGELHANCESGITLRANGLIEIEGDGELYANQIRTSVFGASNIGGYVQRGGSVVIDGTRPGGVSGDYYTFCMTYPGNLFHMSGGTLRVAGASTDGLIFIGSDESQISVTGGTIIAEVNTNQDRYRISSRAPFWNLIVRRTHTGTGVNNKPIRITGGVTFSSEPFPNGTRVVPDLPLVIKNSLEIESTNAPTLRMRSDTNVDLDLHLEGNLTIQNGGIYAHFLNTTYFDGNSSGLLSLPTTVTQTFNNVIVDKVSDIQFIRILAGNSTHAMEVQGDFTLENGYVDNLSRHVKFLKNVTLNGVFGTATATGRADFLGLSAQTLVSNDGVFHNVTINNVNGLTLDGGMLTVRRTLSLTNGIFDIQNHKLRIEGANGDLSISSPSLTKCIRTDGTASAGGLEMVYLTATQNTIFPLGVPDGLSTKYTPAQIRVNSGYVDDGYIQVVPVDALLETVDLSAGGDYLDFYWKIRHSEFTNVPYVSHLFTYASGDETGPDLASGRVLTDLPFSREIDSLTFANDHVQLVNERFYFNGATDGTTISGDGTMLVNADYTAGFADRFIGAPEVYYSRSTTYNAQWDIATNWNEASSFSPGSGPYDWHGTSVSPASDYPQTGDLAIIGFNPANGRPHVFAAQTTGTQVAKVAFTPLQTSLGAPLPRYNSASASDITVRRPTLSVNAQLEIAEIREISGEGTILMRNPVNIQAIDVAGFLIEDSSIVMIQAGSTFDITQIPTNLPNLYITSTSDGSGNFSTIIRPNIFVRGDLEVVGNANLFMNAGSTGDIHVGGDFILARYQAVSSGPELLYDALGISRTIQVDGDFRLLGLNAQVRIVAADAPQTIHRLSVGKNIIQSGNSSSLNLFTNPTDDYIALELFGSGNHSFIKTSGTDPSLGSITLDKGVSTASSFTFNSNFTLGLPSDAAVKPLVLRNGLLVLNNSLLNLSLSSGGGSFEINSTSGLHLQNGNLSITGNQTGLLLDGYLKLSGGVLAIGNTIGENNFIEVGSSGVAEIEITNGQLLVGSQLRRSLTNTSGILKYNQSGGTCRVGIYSAPNTNRGVFEVLNTGSSFIFTGGNLELVRGVNSATLPSLRLDPEVSNTIGTGVLQIGTVQSPAGAEISNIGIQSSVAFNELRIDNSSGNNPVAKLYILPLTIRNLLDIDAGATLNCGIQSLTIQGDIQNDGVFTASNSFLYIDHTTNKSINGSGTFQIYNLNRLGNALTTVNADLTVNRSFIFNTTGTMNFGDHKITVISDVNIDGTLLFSAASDGLVLAGNSPQILRRSTPGITNIQVLTINNLSGVNMIASAGYTFNIARNLRLQRGVFDLKGNLIELGTSAAIIPVSSFGETNMINTGGAYTNFGVHKMFAANNTTDFLVPLGINKYMPINLIFSGTGGSSGNAISSYLFRLNIPYHPTVVNDLEAPAPEINDYLNVLQMYFSLDAANVGANLKMNAEFYYDQSFVAVTAPYNEAQYIGARVVDGSPTPSIFKFPSGVVNSLGNILTFTFDGATAEGITGDYFAGIDSAIVDLVPVYTTTRNGDVTEGEFPGGVYDAEVPGLGAPNGSVVIISDEDELNFNINGVNFYKTIIEENATLVISATSQHRLGIVEGTGTIKLVGTGNLPAGNYNSFFTCAGGKMEYAGTTNYDVLANIPTVRRVTLSGSGTRTMANNDVTICEDLEIFGPNFTNFPLVKITVEDSLVQTGGTFNVGTGELVVEGDAVISGGNLTTGTGGIRTFEGNLDIAGGTYTVGSSVTNLQGDLNFDSGVFSGGTSTGKFVFNGSASQFITGDLQSPNNFVRLEINNPTGLTLAGQVDVSSSLLLTDGNIFTSNINTLHLTSSTTSTVLPVGGSADSFVEGPLDWTLPLSSASASLDRIFPIGKTGEFRPLRLSNRSAARRWTAEYFYANAGDAPTSLNMVPAVADEDLIEAISVQEYWSLNSNTSDPTTAKVGLSWGSTSGVSTSGSDYNALLTLIYESGAWANKGGASFSYSGITGLGTFMGTALSSFTQKYFTLGSSLGVNPLPVTWLYFNGSTDGNLHTLRWATGSEENNSHFVLERSNDAQNWVNIAEIQGAGFSTETKTYSYVDRQAPYGRSYYRIKQVDFDTRFEYSEHVVSLERAFEAESGQFDFILFPNPNHIGQARLIASTMNGMQVELSIFDMMGKQVAKEMISIDEQGMSMPFDCAFKPGVYLIKLRSGEKSGTKKLVIAN